MTPEQLILKTIRNIHSDGGHPNLEAIGTEGLASAAEKFLKILGGLTGGDDAIPAQIEAHLNTQMARPNYTDPAIPQYRFPWNDRTQTIPKYNARD